MKESFFEPPGLHQQHEQGFCGILKRVGTLNTEIKRNDKQNLSRALEIGRMLLRARPMAAAGEWDSALKEQDISSQRASDFMWAAAQPQEQQAGWGSIADMRRARAELNQPPSKEDIPLQGDTPPIMSTNPAAGMAPAPTKPPILCSACQRRGWVPGCNVCEFLNRPAKGERRPPPVPEIIEEVAPEPGSYAWKPFSWAQVNASLSLIFEQLHALAQEYDRIDDPRYAEIKDTAVAFSAAISAFHKTIKGKK